MKFEDVLQKYNIPYRRSGHHHCTTGFIQLNCPYCGKNTHKFHMGYNIENKFFNCWRCGSHGFFDTMMELTGLSFHQIRELTGKLEPSKIKEEKITGHLIIPKGAGQLLSAHIKYLTNRGFEPAKLVNLWHIQGIGITTKLSWRIFIPIHYHSRVVSWTTRSLDPNAPARYINASLEEEAINHKKLLYGEDFAGHSIIVTEGPLDVWKIGPGTVATCGLGITAAQILQIIKHPKRYICFDNEKEAQKMARKLCTILSCFQGETNNIILDSKDAAESTEKELKSLRKLLK